MKRYPGFKLTAKDGSDTKCTCPVRHHVAIDLDPVIDRYLKNLAPDEMRMRRRRWTLCTRCGMEWASVKGQTPARVHEAAKKYADEQDPRR